LRFQAAGFVGSHVVDHAPRFWEAAHLFLTRKHSTTSGRVAYVEYECEFEIVEVEDFATSILTGAVCLFGTVVVTDNVLLIPLRHWHLASCGGAAGA